MRLLSRSVQVMKISHWHVGTEMPPMLLLLLPRTSTCAVALAMVLAAAHAAPPAAHGAAAPPASAADAAVWPHACTAVAGYNQTRCPKSATCCASKFSGSGQGCCPWPGAVCCKNQLTCCPAGSECDDTIPPHWPSWGAVTTCKPAATTGAGAAVQGKCVCKPGAPQPMSTTKKNVLVIGDSVSIGYTPAVASLLADVALVQHAPWGGDGGAEETAYGIQCLDYWLRGPSGGPISPDVLFWNFGLHDGPQLFSYPPANVTIPGQEGNMSVFPAQIAQLGQTLKSWAQQSGTKLLFGVTTPMLGDARADQDVSSLNAAAKQAMDRLGIPTVDMHAAIIAKCGTPPQKQCFGINGCFNPHCETALSKLAEGSASAECLKEACLACRVLQVEGRPHISLAPQPKAVRHSGLPSCCRRRTFNACMPCQPRISRRLLVDGSVVSVRAADFWLANSTIVPAIRKSLLLL
eukprot:COSAG01_NODE_63_length_29632_cov_270.650662_14_plen_463_part_00